MLDQNKATIRRIREELVPAHNLAALDELYTEDYVYHGIPMLGERKGRSAFRDMMAGFLAALPDLRENVSEQVAENDRVVTLLVGSGTHSGPLLGIPGTGRRINWSGVVISRFATDGRIAEEWVEFDALSLLQQLGAVLQMPATAA
jgi:steroid delta-isomerase-like uncharacterized protein